MKPNSAAEPRQGQTIRPQRIQVADVHPLLSQRNGKMLIDAGQYAPTVKYVRWVIMTVVMLQLFLTARISAQDAPSPPSGLRMLSSGDAARSNAVVISAHSAIRPNAVVVSFQGKCDCSEDGVTFTNLERGRILEQGATIRTGDGGWADLFFWRTGATVRLQAGTEMKFEKMVINVRAGRPAMHIELELRAGKIFTVVRSAKAESTLEIRNAAGRSEVEGSRVGRYIITADGTHVSDKDSAVPLKLIGENGTTFIAAGEQFTKQDGKTLTATSNLFVQDLAQLNELQAVAEHAVP